MNRAQPATRRAAVIGRPVGHSLSPLIHGYWLEKYGVKDASYEALEVPRDGLAATVRAMKEGGFTGFNVTIPCKREIMALCDTIDETARRIGAVNTVVVGQGGALHGLNTDSCGFAESLRAADAAAGLAGAAALVLGAGGAARAILHALEGLKVATVRIANRTREKAQELAQDFPAAQVVAWEEREEAAAGTALLVNATSLGMTGQPPLDFSLSALPAQAAICDIVYRPLMTPLLCAAKARGNPIVAGTGMLVHQARPAFREWFGIMPGADAELLQKIGEAAQR